VIFDARGRISSARIIQRPDRDSRRSSRHEFTAIRASCERDDCYATLAVPSPGAHNAIVFAEASEGGALRAISRFASRRFSLSRSSKLARIAANRVNLYSTGQEEGEGSGGGGYLVSVRRSAVKLLVSIGLDAPDSVRRHELSVALCRAIACEFDAAFIRSPNCAIVNLIATSVRRRTRRGLRCRHREG